MEIERFEQGLARLLDLVPKIPGQKFVAIHAPGPNHGKSHLGRTLRDELVKQGVRLGRVNTGCSLEDVEKHSRVEEIKRRDGCVYEDGSCGLFKGSLNMMDRYNQRLFEKPVDYHVVVWNPHMSTLNCPLLEKEGMVDMLIINPSSVEKGSYKTK